MPRKGRFNLIGYPQHVIQRGNNRQACFVNDEDREFYKECLLDACKKYDVAVHAYVLMTNHVHIAMTPGKASAISKAMQSLGRRYVRYFNYVYERTGTLWEGRYKASLVDTDTYMLTLLKYIELNPVRAGMVDMPQAYPWSSYRHHGYGYPDELMSTHDVYRNLGCNNSQRQRNYRAWFKHDITLAERKMIGESITHGLVMGSEQFKDMLEMKYGLVTRLGKAGRPCKE